MLGRVIASKNMGWTQWRARNSSIQRRYGNKLSGNNWQTI